jgi:membrane protein DedA with SNARE-associated domain
VTGFSLPVSEDLLLLASGVLASTVLPEYTWGLFLAALLGSYVSDVIAFVLGRLLGKKIYRTKSDKMQKLASYYKKYGLVTLVVGRCIPFGVRNGIFMTAGASKMPFGKFLLSDGLACLAYSGLIFFIAYSCGKNYEQLVNVMHQTNIYVGLFALAFLGALSIYLIVKRRKKARADTT